MCMPSERNLNQLFSPSVKNWPLSRNKFINIHDAVK